MADVEKTVLKKSNSNEDGNPKAGVNTKKSLSIIQKVLAELNLNGTNILFLAIMEKVFNFNNTPEYNKRRLQIDTAVILLDLLKTCNVEYYNEIFHDLEKLFMSKELRKLVVKGISLKGLFKLDEGDCGTVHLGEFNKSDGSTQLVAIKVAKGKLGGEMLGEANILARLDHKNVIKLVAFQRYPNKIIMEHMALGHLAAAVQAYKFTNRELLGALYDVASGMEYIGEQKYVHRDLFCKNVFVDSNKVCRIGDFGFARYFGYSSDGQYKETVSWVVEYHTSPEAVANQVFSTKSDVYSFGILVWEIYSTAENMSKEMALLKVISDLPKFFLSGCSSLPRPNLCPIPFHDYVCESLLNRNPDSRPTFTAIKKKIGDLMSSTKPK